MHVHEKVYLWIVRGGARKKEGVMWPRQEQVLLCTLQRLKCERHVEGENLGDFFGLPGAFLSVSSHRTENTEQQLRVTFHNGFFAVGFWMFFSFLHCTNGKEKNSREMKEMLQNNREDICPCIYYLFSSVICLTFLNHSSSGKPARLVSQLRILAFH